MSGSTGKSDLTTIPTQEFRGLVEELTAALSNCEHKVALPTQSYRAAIRLCATNRDLITVYVNEWLSDVALEVYAADLRELFMSAARILESVRDSGVLNPSERKHAEKMVGNSQRRIAILEVIAGEGDVEEKHGRIMELYREVAKARGFDLSIC